MAKPSTPDVWASGKSFAFQPSQAQQAQGFDYIATVRPSTGAPITDDHDWPLNQITTALKWAMDQLPASGIQQLIDALLPKRAFIDNDYIRIPDAPGGLIVQWTSASNTNNLGPGYSSVNFPVAFPNKCFGIVMSPYASSAGGFNNVFAITDQAFSKTSFNWVARNSAGQTASPGAVGMTCVAFGS